MVPGDVNLETENGATQVDLVAVWCAMNSTGLWMFNQLRMVKMGWWDFEIGFPCDCVANTLAATWLKDLSLHVWCKLNKHILFGFIALYKLCYLLNCKNILLYADAL